MPVKCVVSDMLENNASLEEKINGSDLADFIVKYPVQEFSSSNVVLTQKGELINNLISINPSIKKLIKKFKLIV